MRIRFHCRATSEVDVDTVTSPTCPVHGAACRVIGVVDAPPPSFRGAVSGPMAVRQRVEPMAVNLASTPLTLKPEGQTDANARV